MTDTPDEDVAAEFYEIVGRIASDWSHLEMQVNDCIWALAGVGYGAGACITAQIYTFDGRMKALLSLLRLRQVDETFVKKVIRFHEISRKAGEIRNRAIHDAYGTDTQGDAVRFVVTANKQLSLGFDSADIEEARKNCAEVEKQVVAFKALKGELSAMLPSLPRTQKLALHSTFRARYLK